MKMVFKNVCKLLGIGIAAVLLGTAAYADEVTEYVPLRAAFESQGSRVEWSDEKPDAVIVTMGNYPITFNMGTNTVITDEGSFTTEGEAYIKDGTAYVSQDSVELCSNLLSYHNAIIDSMQADEDERMPLRPYAVAGERVLVGTWHEYPESYKDGETIDLKYGDVWVFASDELFDWGQDNGMAENMTLRMEQLFGLAPQSGKTHFTLMWVNPADMFRPSPDCNIDDDIAELTFPEDTTEEYKQWFNNNIIASYYPHKFPWTRLGYTYDWADNGSEYGLSEFIVRKGAEATVEKTYTNEEYFDYITSR